MSTWLCYVKRLRWKFRSSTRLMQRKPSIIFQKSRAWYATSSPAKRHWYSRWQTCNNRQLRGGGQGWGLSRAEGVLEPCIERRSHRRWAPRGARASGRACSLQSPLLEAVFNSWFRKWLWYLRASSAEPGQTASRQSYGTQVHSGTLSSTILHGSWVMCAPVLVRIKLSIISALRWSFSNSVLGFRLLVPIHLYRSYTTKYPGATWVFSSFWLVLLQGYPQN